MEILNAVIYCRVSTKDQTDGYSLKYQEEGCRDFALKSNYSVYKVFIERGESAKTTARTELQKLLKFITLNKKIIDVLIVHKLDRLSRSVYDISDIKLILSKLNIDLKSATEPFDETAIGKFTSNMLASLARFDNDLRSERTVKGMAEALKEGRWVFPAPLGYTFKKDINGKTNIFPDENSKYIIKAFEYFNTGNYRQTDIVKKLRKEGLLNISKQKINHMLKNPLYAGIIRHDFLPEPIQGSFKPLISEEDFYTVQRLLNPKKPINKKRLRINPDFPLKNIFYCPYCRKPLTGSWSTGRNNKYAYYSCRTKGCNFKNTRRKILENEFLLLLDKLRPSKKILKLFNEVVLNIWDKRIHSHKKRITELQSKLKRLYEKRKNINELVLNGTYDKQTYKEMKNDTDNEITVIKIELNEIEANKNDIEILINQSNYFLNNLKTFWLTADIDSKQKFQNIIFPKGTYYKDGFIGTIDLATIFKVFREENIEKSKMVGLSGLEPETSSLSGMRSNLLSYRPTGLIIE